MNFSEYIYAYGWNRFNMGVIGVWPEPGENIILRNRAWFYSLLIFVLIWIPQFASVSVFWGNLNETIECLSTNVPVGVSVMKLVVFRYQRKGRRGVVSAIEIGALYSFDLNWFISLNEFESMKWNEISGLWKL